MEGIVIPAQDAADRQGGYDAAMNARPYAVPPSIKDRTCWIAGYMEGTPQPRKRAKAAPTDPTDRA
jgi:hypothetical protein